MQFDRFYRLFRAGWLLAALTLTGGASALAAPATCAAGASAAACAASAPASHAPLRFRQDGQVEGRRPLLGPYEIVLGLALVGGVLYWWWRKHGLLRTAGGTDGDLQVVSQRRLSGKTTLYVIRHRDREILLAEHERGITTIKDYSDS